jgi:hypothetical protein
MLIIRVIDRKKRPPELPGNLAIFAAEGGSPDVIQVIGIVDPTHDI